MNVSNRDARNEWMWKGVTVAVASTGSSLNERVRRAAMVVAVFGVPATMLPFGGNVFGPPKLFVLMWAAAIIAITIAVDPSAGERAIRVMGTSWIARAGALLVVLSAVSIFFAPQLDAAIIGGYPDYRGLLVVVACAAFAVGVLCEPDAFKLIPSAARASSVLLVYLFVIALGERLGLPPATFKVDGIIRVISTAGNSSNLGVVLVLFAPFAVRASLADVRKEWRLVGAAATVGAVVMLAWTLSRGAWLGALAAVLVGALYAVGQIRSASKDVSRRPRHTRTVVAVVALALGGVLIAALAMPQVVPRAGELLETRSSTAQWRFSAWRSAVTMITDRPLTGFGTNGFRLAYPAYKDAGQDAGRRGYLPTESPHNVVLEAGTSLGVPGVVAAVALAVLAWLVLLRQMRLAEPSYRGDLVAVAAALAAGLVALQFHYLTIDTGPAATALLAILALAESRGAKAGRAGEPSTTHGGAASAVLPILLAVVLLASAVVATALLAADVIVSRSGGAAAPPPEWAATRDRVALAMQLAPWEPGIPLKAGRIAMTALEAGAGPGVAEDGHAWYALARDRSPLDPYIATEAGWYYVMESIMALDPSMLIVAEEAFADAARLDPNSGMPLAGIGRVQLMRADVDGALETLERSVALSPDNRAAWRDLADVYEQLGRSEDAASALRRAGVSQ